MDLGDDEIRREERDPAPERLSEEAIGVEVVLVAPAPQRDPGAAIDERPRHDPRRYSLMMMTSTRS